ncbi:hypothetical protein M1397_03815 [Candidatus Marsarchaeota archaeon]|jgi:hypothetical protein|nr:hypothetical protein [Candidatus Marsarchaeota archaeon]
MDIDSSNAFYLALSLSGAFSLILIFQNLLLYGVFALVATAVSLLLYRKRAEPELTDSDVLGFVGALVNSYSMKGNMPSALEEAVPVSPRIGKAMKERVYAYKAGAKDAFLHGYKIGNRWLELVVKLIARAMDDGHEVKGELNRLYDSMTVALNDKMAANGAVKNASFMGILGATLFFPLFSGISIGILSYAPSIGQVHSVSLSSLALLFSAFILIEIFINFKDRREGLQRQNVPVMLLCGAAGLLLFKLSSLFAIRAI